MSAAGLLAAGYALLMGAAAWGLRVHAGKVAGTWVAREASGFARVIALVPLAVGDAVLLGVAVAEHGWLARALLAVPFVWLTRTAWQEWGRLRATRRAGPSHAGALDRPVAPRPER